MAKSRQRVARVTCASTIEASQVAAHRSGGRAGSTGGHARFARAAGAFGYGVGEANGPVRLKVPVAGSYSSTEARSYAPS